MSTPVFPFYIDEEIVMSFLATVDGGYQTQERLTQTSENAEARSLQGEVEASGRLLNLFGAGAKLASGGSSDAVISEFLEYQRQHTVASRFNFLRDKLNSLDMIKSFERAHDQDISSGDIVEFECSIDANPLVQLKKVWAAYLRMRPNWGEATTTTAKTESTTRQQSKKNVDLSKPINKEERQIQAILDEGEQGFSDQGLMDVAVKTGHQMYREAVLTFKVALDLDRTFAFSTGSTCKVIGKVTGIYGAGSEIAMYRRSGLKMFTTDVMESIFKPMRELKEVNIDIDQVSVPGPAIQVLPFAVFV